MSEPRTGSAAASYRLHREIERASQRERLRRQVPLLLAIAFALIWTTGLIVCIVVPSLRSELSDNPIPAATIGIITGIFDIIGIRAASKLNREHNRRSPRQQ